MNNDVAVLSLLSDYPDYKVYCVCCRFIAVSIPLNYNRKHVDMRQTVLLSATWILALAVASPVMFGINNVPGRDSSECKLENDDYVLYSSVCSFFIPCPIMVLLYFGMFRGLRRWEEARRAKLKNSIQACRKLQEAAASLPPLASLPPPLPPIIERELTDTPDEPSTFPSADKPFQLSDYKDGPVPTVSFADIRFNPDPQRKKRAKINNRERKAMKVLPVVVGEFTSHSAASVLSKNITTTPGCKRNWSMCCKQKHVISDAECIRHILPPACSTQESPLAWLLRTSPSCSERIWPIQSTAAFFIRQTGKCQDQVPGWKWCVNKL